MSVRPHPARLLRLALVGLVALLLLGVTVAGAAAGATLRAPATVPLNGRVTAHASGLLPGRYGLYIGVTISHPKGGEAVVCSGPVGSARKVSGRASFSGRLPRFLGCRSSGGPLLGTRKIAPGKYTLVLGVPIGGGNFEGSASFLSRSIQVTS